MGKPIPAWDKTIDKKISWEYLMKGDLVINIYANDETQILLLSENENM